MNFDVKTNLKKVLSDLPSGVKLVAVSKYHPAEYIMAAYEEGQGKLKGNGRSVPPLSAIKNPLRDGDTERPDDPASAGCYFINTSVFTF